jgi:hypothetical protein
MAWISVPGNPEWEYDDSPTLGELETGAKAHPDDQYYRDAVGTVSGGIRTYTINGVTRQVYLRCRKISNPKSVGDLDKTYYDNRNR